MNYRTARDVLWIFCLAGALAQPARAQPKVPPIWPGPSFDPREGKGQYVYLTPERNAMVVYDPRRVEKGFGARCWLIPLLNEAKPRLSVEIRRTRDGNFEYRYTLDNLPEARTPIGRFDLAGEPDDPHWKVRHRPQGPEEMTPLGRVVTVSWSTTRPVAPGALQGGFTILSDFAPALVQAFARAGDLQVPDDLPEEVRKQLEVWQAPEWRDRSVWIIGPRYPANFPRNVAANEFATVMSVMAIQRQLDPDSRFVREAMVQLRALAAGEAPFPANLAFAALAVTPKEKQLAEAIRLTLSSQ